MARSLFIVLGCVVLNVAADVRDWHVSLKLMNEWLNEYMNVGVSVCVVPAFNPLTGLVQACN